MKVAFSLLLILLSLTTFSQTIPTSKTTTAWGRKVGIDSLVAFRPFTDKQQNVQGQDTLKVDYLVEYVYNPRKSGGVYNKNTIIYHAIITIYRVDYVAGTYRKLGVINDGFYTKEITPLDDPLKWIMKSLPID